MNQSIYTERKNILPHHAEWLDGCGATWMVFSDTFSKGVNERMQNVIFNGMGKNGFSHSSDPDINYTHIPTGTEFCERVAEILGLDKPTFEVDISKTETTTDHIPDIGKKVDEQDKLFPGRNNTMGEGSLTQEDIEILLGDSIVKPIKGMAIEVSRLSEEDREYLEALNPTNLYWEYCACSEIEGKGFNFINYYSNQLFKGDYTITESPAEFLKYVAQQTGKEYKKEWGQTHGNPRTSQPVSESYKFKTYRILDSLDGIPLDKRIPLSEWIPPFGEEVLILSKFLKAVGHVKAINHGNRITFWMNYKADMNLDLDGHWMRIV